MLFLFLWLTFCTKKPCPLQVSGSPRDAEAAPPSITGALVSHQRRFSEKIKTLKTFNQPKPGG